MTYCTCFCICFTANSHHSNSSGIQAVFTPCHELCLTMEEEEVVAVGFPSPVDDLKVPGNWRRNGLPFSFGSLLCKKIDCDCMQYYAIVIITRWLKVLSRCLSSRIRALTVVYTFIKARHCPWLASCLTARYPQVVHSWGAICGESRLFAEGRTIFSLAGVFTWRWFHFSKWNNT